MNRITIGFSIHRPEIISITADLIGNHEAIFLEDAPLPGFQRMLQGRLAVEDYLLSAEVEYPEFSRGMCRLLRQLHRNGKKILQVEPFLQNLFEIHAFFSQGHGPKELKPESIQRHVYLAERTATKALLDYYQTVINGSFEAAVKAIMRFARYDAVRFRLRDSLRAQALATQVTRYPSAFIEAGAIHYSLYPLLRNRLPKKVQIKFVFTAHKALKTLGQKGHLFGPGDQLTLTYIFHPAIKRTQRQALLAARSLIYTKLIEKEELSADLTTFPHIRNELACIRAVRLLSLGDCSRLFPLIRRLKTAQARQLVDDYFRRLKKHPRSITNRLAF
ncbi:MAG: hypothetical protein PVI71_03035 [Desulfobacterales bacterium]|jgi:hypothetical protein